MWIFSQGSLLSIYKKIYFPIFLANISMVASLLRKSATIVSASIFKYSWCLLYAVIVYVFNLIISTCFITYRLLVLPEVSALKGSGSHFERAVSMTVICVISALSTMLMTYSWSKFFSDCLSSVCMW